jgi:hypothetical protein
LATSEPIYLKVESYSRAFTRGTKAVATPNVAILLVSAAADPGGDERVELRSPGKNADVAPMDQENNNKSTGVGGCM